MNRNKEGSTKEWDRGRFPQGSDGHLRFVYSVPQFVRTQASDRDGE